MILADYIFIGAAILFGIVGLTFGFGKLLSGMTKGLKGILISVVVCYLIFGFVLNLDFVQTLLAKLSAKVAESDSGIVNFLQTIHIELIVLAVVLFAIVQVVRKLIVSAIERVMESDNVVMKAINKTLGMVFAFAIFLALVLIAGQVTYWVDGAEGSAYEALRGSFFRLDELYLVNPLTSIVKL